MMTILSILSAGSGTKASGYITIRIHYRILYNHKMSAMVPAAFQSMIQDAFTSSITRVWAGIVNRYD